MALGVPAYYKEVLSRASATGRGERAVGAARSEGRVGIVIDGGEHLPGMLDKKTLGTSAGGLVHVIFNEYGPRGARATS